MNTLTELVLGDGVWVHVTARFGAHWEVPAFNVARQVHLVSGFNLVMWTGPDQTPIVEAIGGLVNALEALFVYDSSAQRFLSIHAATYDTFNTRRHIDSAADHRQVGRQAFAAWREAAGVAA